jgi:bis(5'-nucleosidyl)-tetraphosphatase
MKHILAAGIVPVLIEKPTEKLTENKKISFLLLRAFNYWDFPKGETEKDEDPFLCALRELKEETLISSVTFPWGKDFRETLPYGKGKVARYYLGQCLNNEVSLPISPELGTPEHHEFRWVSADEARKLVNARLLPILEWAEQKILESSN